MAYGAHKYHVYKCMSITKKEVEHIAHLARIELSAEEKTHFVTELADIMSFVETLRKLDTPGVKPVTGGTTLQNVMRADEQNDKELEGFSMLLVDAAPQKKEQWIKVKAVFE